MIYLPLLLLLLPIIAVPVGAVIIGRDLWRHELARFGIVTRIILLVGIFDAALFFLTLVFLLEKMRSLR